MRKRKEETEERRSKQRRKGRNEHKKQQIIISKIKKRKTDLYLDLDHEKKKTKKCYNRGLDHHQQPKGGPRFHGRCDCWKHCDCCCWRCACD